MRSRSEAGKKKRDVREEAEAAAAGVDDGPETEERDANHDGVKLTVTWGEEGHIPKQYHTFKVGPLSATVEVPPGKPLGPVIMAVHKELETAGDVLFEQKLENYLDRQRRASAAGRG